MSFSKEFHAAGAREEQARAPAALSLEWLQGECDRLERVIRLQPEWERISEPYQIELETLNPTNTTRALQRWALLKHLYRVREEGLSRRELADAQGAQEAARQLLRREPVRVELGERTVEVTSRSYAAMAEIAAHATRIRALEEDLGRVDELQRRCLAQLTEAQQGRGTLRRRMGRLADVEVQIQSEILAHRRAIYAHALTRSGGPAATLDAAPEWWREIDARWDAVLLLSLFEVGAGRYQQLGPAPASDGRAKAPPEDFGWGSLFASVERQQKMEPASLYDQDLYQVLTWLRAAAAPPVEVEG